MYKEARRMALVLFQRADRISQYHDYPFNQNRRLVATSYRYEAITILAAIDILRIANGELK